MARTEPNAARLLWLLALALAGGWALLAGRVEPPENDLLLHGHMAACGAEALTRHGWAAFQDPWCSGLNGGFPLYRIYPHLGHQLAALTSLLGLSAPGAVGLWAALATLLTPVAAALGASFLGLERRACAWSALAAVALQSADRYGHTLPNYGFEGAGLFAQQIGMTLGLIALPAWWAAASPTGRGLARWPRWLRGALAASLLSLVLRAHLPTFWVLVWTGLPGLLVLETRRDRLATAGRGVLWLGLAGALGAGFLIPFIRALPTVASSPLEAAEKLRSVGAREVLRRLLLGHYLDGAAIGGWTALWLLAQASAWRRTSGPGAPVRRALALSGLVSLVLLFGRATWGDWVDRVPLVGRFHDHRYLLGLHATAPLLLGASLPLWLRRMELRGAASRRAWAPLAAGLLVLPAAWSLVRAQRSVSAQLEDWPERRAALERMTLRVIEESQGWPIGPGTPDPTRAGGRAQTWLIHRGLPTVGLSLHHYNHLRDFSWYWRNWLVGEQSPRRRPLQLIDGDAIGGAALLVEPGPRPPAQGLVGVTLSDGFGLLRPPPRPTVTPFGRLVRAPLLMRADDSGLDGFALGWFAAGMAERGQHPVLQLAGAPGEAPDRFQRSGRIADRDRSVFDLPAERPPEGQIEALAGEALRLPQRLRVRTRDAESWLLLPISWHPELQAHIDGQPEAVRLMAPGLAGIPLAEGEQEVALSWPISPLRGWWAALATALDLLVLAACLGMKPRSAIVDSQSHHAQAP